MESKPPAVAFLPQIVLYIVLGIIDVCIIIFAPEHIWSSLLLSALVICCVGGVSFYTGKKCDCKK
jgi:hypothetical protein